MKSAELQRNIKQVVDQVVALTTPLKVILFGSAATGKIGPDSDLDFLVVIPETEQPSEVVDRLYMGVRKKPMPCDFLVVTMSSLKKNCRNPSLIYNEILKRGREVYVS